MQLFSSTRINCKRYCLWWHSTHVTHTQKYFHKNAHFWFIHMHVEWLVIRLLVEWPLEIRNAAGSNISNNHKFKWASMLLLLFPLLLLVATLLFTCKNANPTTLFPHQNNQIQSFAVRFVLDFNASPFILHIYLLIAIFFLICDFLLYFSFVVVRNIFKS